MKRHREDVVGVSAEHLAGAAIEFPKADRAVQPAGGQPTTIGAEGDRHDLFLVALESGGRLMRPRIQEEHRLPIRSEGRQPAAVGAVSQGPAFGREQALAGPNVADDQAANLVLRVERRHGHSVSVRTDGQKAEGPVGNLDFPSVQVVTDPVGLRAAIAYANSHPGPDIITLDPAAFGKSRRTIVLTGGPLVLTDPATTTIIGPGMKQLTLSGGGKSRVFDIQGGSLALSGVTIADGRADLGGGVRNEGGSLTLTKVAIRGNRALVGGGLFNNGAAALKDVVIHGNKALVGSGLFDTRKATLRWRWSPARLHAQNAH